MSKNRNLKHHDHWKTPDWYMQKLNKEFNFNFNPCRYKNNIEEYDGLAVEWGTRTFVNPPYSQKLKNAFVFKAIDEAKKGKLIVMLLPVSTSTILFHDFIIPSGASIRFIKGRLNFMGTNEKGQIVNHPNPTSEIFPYRIETIKDSKMYGAAIGEFVDIALHVKNSGQHDSMLVIFDGRSWWTKLKYIFTGK